MLKSLELRQETGNKKYSEVTSAIQPSAWSLNVEESKLLQVF